MRSTLWLTLILVVPLPAFAQPDLSLDHMAGTEPLVMDEPLDVVMVRGINYFAERELADSPNRRAAKWNRDYSSPEAYQRSIEPNRQRLREIIGAVDERVARPILTTEVIELPGFENQLSADPNWGAPFSVRWDVLQGVSATGILLLPSREPTAHVILLPDADWRPELMYGGAEGLGLEQQTALRLAQSGCDVLIPTLVSRSDEFSGHPEVRFTNQPHREFIYRMAFEMGRHIIGFEVQKVLAAVDWLEQNNALAQRDVPIMVAGIGEGGLLALQSAALDTRIDGAMISGYFTERESVWREPIYRNVWNQLTEFGDAEIASLIAPRLLVIEACAVPHVSGPPAPHESRSGGAAPGWIVTPEIESIRREFSRAEEHYRQLEREVRFNLSSPAMGMDPTDRTPL